MPTFMGSTAVVLSDRPGPPPPAETGRFSAADKPLKAAEEFAAMITVYHLGISQSERIVWLCEELAIPYALRRYDRDPITHLAPADYKALHPMGAAPVITDGDLVLAES